MAVVGQFMLIVFGVLLFAKLARIVLFDGAGESLGGGDTVIAIAVAVMVTGGWLRRSGTKS